MTGSGALPPLKKRPLIEDKRPRRGRAARLWRSDFDLLRDAERVVDLDAEVPDGAFEFRVPEQ